MIILSDLKDGSFIQLFLLPLFFRQVKNEEVMRLAGEMKRERDEELEKEEILFELHEGRVREAERRKEALELELEIRAVLLSTNGAALDKHQLIFFFIMRIHNWFTLSLMFKVVLLDFISKLEHSVSCGVCEMLI